MKLYLNLNLEIYPNNRTVIFSFIRQIPIPNSKIVIRKGDFVRLNNIGIMMDPEIYPNPLDYNPDRFMKEYASDRNPYSFLPFSLGPRNCIGMRFAMYEMKCCISNLVSKKFRGITKYPFEFFFLTQ